MRYYLFIFWITLILTGAEAQSKHEVRAAWLTTAYGLDWPATKATSPAQAKKQKQELARMLDRLKEANFNTILFQARMRGDVIYPSSIEPFSEVLTGKSGQNPGYDPLAFAIEECHRRGMECHAWVIAIPLGSKKHASSFGKNATTVRKSSLCVSIKNDWYLNPGNPQTKEYLMSIVREIISRYDVDGIHLDYIRYPERARNFPDNKEYKLYGKGKDKTQWRRDNITEIVRHIYKGVKEVKPWVKVSSSPVGKFRDTSRYSSHGWNAYHIVYQDAQKWMAEGIQDQLYPMLYFKGDHFYPFVLDWKEQSYDRHIVPGLGIYFLDPSEGNWEAEDIERQLHFINRNKLAGTGFYRAKFLTNNTKGVYDIVSKDFYTSPALQPPMPWLDQIAPTPPSECRIEQYKGYLVFSWKAALDNDPHNAPRYVVYASDTYPVDTNNPAHIIAQNVEKPRFVYAPLTPWEAKRCFAITAIDRYGNESEAMQFVCP